MVVLGWEVVHITGVELVDLALGRGLAPSLFVGGGPNAETGWINYAVGFGVGGAARLGTVRSGGLGQGYPLQ